MIRRQSAWLGPAIVLVALAAACSAFNPNVGPLIDAAPPSCTPEQGSGEYGGYGSDTEDAGAGSCDGGS